MFFADGIFLPVKRSFHFNLVPFPIQGKENPRLSWVFVPDVYFMRLSRYYEFIVRHAFLYGYLGYARLKRKRVKHQKTGRSKKAMK
jgi:hypothetical protein